MIRGESIQTFKVSWQYFFYGFYLYCYSRFTNHGIHLLTSVSPPIT